MNSNTIAKKATPASTQARRVFVIQAIAATAAGTAASLVFAQKPAPAASAAMPDNMVKDTDANAVALGYLNDGSKTDTKKYAKYAKDQNCANCSLYQGKAADKAAACPLFAGKQVAAKGWCSAWVKKAA